MRTWVGLGLGLFRADITTYDDMLLVNGFLNQRIDMPDYEDATGLADSKTAVLLAIAKGANVVWGVSSNSNNSTAYVITTENWPTFRQAILDNAQWAQDNGVYEFQLGNEEEGHIWRHPTSLVRSSNVTTATFTEDHGFTAANPVSVNGGSDATFDGNPLTITVTGLKTFTYANTGTNGSAPTPSAYTIGNMPEDTINANLKSVATSVKAIFTRGNVSYACQGADYFLSKWYALGLGSIDLLAANMYMNDGAWRTNIANLITNFGASHTYLTEFAPSYVSLADYSADETVQAAGIQSMLDYIIGSGMTRAYFFCFRDDAYGALNANGTTKKAWNVLNGRNTPGNSFRYIRAGNGMSRSEGAT